MGDSIEEILRECRVPAFCPVCERLMTGKESNSTWHRFRACSDCYIQWIEHREDRWAAGWRPDHLQVAAFVASLKAPRYP